MLTYLRQTFFKPIEEDFARHNAIQDRQSAELEAMRARTEDTMQKSRASRQKYECKAEGIVELPSVVPATNTSLTK